MEPSTDNYTRWLQVSTAPPADGAEATESQCLTLNDYQLFYEKMVEYVVVGRALPVKKVHVVYTLYKDSPERNTVVVIAIFQNPLLSQNLGRLMCVLDRRSGYISASNWISTGPLEITERVSETIGISTEYLRPPEPHLDGSLNLSCKIEAQNKADGLWAIQIKSHGYTESTAPFIHFLATYYSGILPVLETYSNTRRSNFEQCIQIYKMSSGIAGSLNYHTLPFEEKVHVLQAVGRAYGAIWEMESNFDVSGYFKSEYFTVDIPSYSIYPYRDFGMGGTFPSVAEYLREWIEMNLRRLEASKHPQLDEYKEKYLSKIKRFVEDGMNIPKEVEEIPWVVMHSDFGPHNLVLSETTPTSIVAILGWEIFYRHPFMVAAPKTIESFFRVYKQNGVQGPCYDDHETLRSAFWKDIPAWEKLYESTQASIFIHWYSFGLLMDPAQHMAFLDMEGFISEDPMESVNCMAVENFLEIWSEPRPEGFQLELSFETEISIDT